MSTTLGLKGHHPVGWETLIKGNGFLKFISETSKDSFWDLGKNLGASSCWKNQRQGQCWRV